MAVKDVAARLYRDRVDRATAVFAEAVDPPAEGWMATARKALGMSAAEVARRLGVTRARVSQAEKAEAEGGVTLRTMRATAEAMGCRFVYAIVPAEGRVEEAILAQARRKARALVGRASDHMALERQGLPEATNRAEAERLARELARTMPADFWTGP